MKIALCLLVLALTTVTQVGPPQGPAPPAKMPQRLSPVVQTCVPCHGASGEGKPDAGFPRIAGQSAYYLLKQLDDYAAGNRDDAAMTPIARGLSPALRAEVAAHYAQVAAPPASSGSAFTASLAERGELLAIRGDLDRGVQACINCHGPGGIGQPPAVPYLAGLHAGYIRATLEAWRNGSRSNDAGEQMAVIAKALAAADLAAVARYFAGAAPPPPASTTSFHIGRPQLLAPHMTQSVMVDTTASADAGVEGRAPFAGGQSGLGQSAAASAGAGTGSGTGAAAGAGGGAVSPRVDRVAATGDVTRGRALVADGAYGCTACHMVPGVRAPRGIVGPRLGGMAQRPFIAGQLANTLDVLTAFLQDPPSLIPATGMPNVGLNAEDARHIAAYLYTLPAVQH